VAGAAHGAASAADGWGMEPAPATADRRQPRPRRERVTTLLVLVAVWAAGCVVLGVVVLQRSVPVRDLLIDPTRLEGAAWYYGLVKSVGVLAWSVAVCGAVTTAYVAGLAGRSTAVRAFRGGALVFTVLLASDLFSLHNAVFPGVLGVDKRAVVVGYGVLAGLWVVGSWPELRRTRWELLVASAVGSGALRPGRRAGRRARVRAAVAGRGRGEVPGGAGPRRLVGDDRPGRDPVRGGGPGGAPGRDRRRPGVALRVSGGWWRPPPGGRGPGGSPPGW
jgi:hypothetical protein